MNVSPALKYKGIEILFISTKFWSLLFGLCCAARGTHNNGT